MTTRKAGRAALMMAAALATCGAVPLHAQQDPTRPVRMLVGFSAGSATDVTARLIAQQRLHFAQRARLDHATLGFPAPAAVSSFLLNRNWFQRAPSMPISFERSALRVKARHCPSDAPCSRHAGEGCRCSACYETPSPSGGRLGWGWGSAYCPHPHPSPPPEGEGIQ